jgi:hypothetical protein
MYMGASATHSIRTLGQPNVVAPPPASALPTVTGITLRTTGNSNALNCCAICPVALGVGSGGMAANGIELRATIEGHRAGFEYDFVRSRRNSLWERRAGAWAELEFQPMGQHDDHHDADECLRIRGQRIYVVDRPGWHVATPIAAGTILTGITGANAHADATDIVLRASFAEWVIARHRKDGIPWRRLTQPATTVWRSITWLNRNGAGQFVLNAARSRIGRGVLSAATLRSAPA